MKKARVMIMTLLAALCLVAFFLQGNANTNSYGSSGGGGGTSWFDGL